MREAVDERTHGQQTPIPGQDEAAALPYSYLFGTDPRVLTGDIWAGQPNPASCSQPPSLVQDPSTHTPELAGSSQAVPSDASRGSSALQHSGNNGGRDSGSLAGYEPSPLGWAPDGGHAQAHEWAPRRSFSDDSSAGRLRTLHSPFAAQQQQQQYAGAAAHHDPFFHNAPPHPHALGRAGPEGSGMLSNGPPSGGPSTSGGHGDGSAPNSGATQATGQQRAWSVSQPGAADMGSGGSGSGEQLGRKRGLPWTADAAGGAGQLHVQERRRLSRRLANRASAERVRHRREAEMTAAEAQRDHARAENARLRAYVAEVEGVSREMAAQLRFYKQRFCVTAQSNVDLYRQLFTMQRQLSGHFETQSFDMADLPRLRGGASSGRTAADLDGADMTSDRNLEFAQLPRAAMSAPQEMVPMHSVQALQGMPGMQPERERPFDVLGGLMEEGPFDRLTWPP